MSVVNSISPGHAQTDFGHAAIRNRARVIIARVNADAVATRCGNVKAARPTLTAHPRAVIAGAHNLRVQPVTGRRSGAPKVGDVRHRKPVDPGFVVTPVFATLPPTLPPTSEFSAAAKTSDDAVTSLGHAIRGIVRTVPDFTSLER